MILQYQKKYLLTREQVYALERLGMIVSNEAKDIQECRNLMVVAQQPCIDTLRHVSDAITTMTREALGT